MSTPIQALTLYVAEIDKIYHTGKATEHSYRPALLKLLEGITTGLSITNEPKHIECGAPDFIITRGDIPLGYIEAKDISIGIANKANKEQFERYKKALGNLIITDYLTFQLFADGNLVSSVSIATEVNKNITADKKQFDAFYTLINQFTNYTGKTIFKSAELAAMMAAKAKLLSQVIYSALKEKNNTSGTASLDNTLSGQLEGFRKILISNLGEHEFSDMYAQTLAYGLFTARLNQSDNQTFTRVIAAQLIPHSNPFLRKLFQYIAGFDLDSRICWIVDALAAIFNCIAVEDIRKEFGKANQDPYIHFYETFLAEYDPKLRESRGVYYTPLPVVQFIVNAVDDILQKEFGLAKGLADNSKIKPPAKGIQQEFHNVQILDPATGTGTFLCEVINKIYSSFKNQKGKWSGYCEEHLIPRLHGFEILMASYAMAHFKLDLTLRETGFHWNNGQNGKNTRFNIYLTNTLGEPENTAVNLPMVEWLAHEANEANSIKRETPVMVILGNPPYSGESYNFTKEEFLEAYKKEPGGIEKLKEKNPKWINDDYVKFIRFGQNIMEKFGGGILAYINNHSFLDNPTFRGMRWDLLKTFDKIYILDLHGNAKKKETVPDGSKDENVFDIQQGASINIFVKTGAREQGLAEVFHCDFYGLRKRKYKLLSEKTLQTIKWKKIKPIQPYYFFVPKDFSGGKEYKQGFGLQELFPVNGVGITTAHDDFVISTSFEKILERFIDFKDSQGIADLLYNNFNVRKKKGWNILEGWNNLQRENNINNYIKKILYRPFDSRFIFYEEKLVWRTVEKIMRHFIDGDNVGITIGRQGQVVGSMPWNLVFITNNITDINLYYRGGGAIFPLYLYPDQDTLDQTETRKPNLNPEIIKQIEQKLNMAFQPESPVPQTPCSSVLNSSVPSVVNHFTPIDILDYIYAVLHSPAYREKYKEFLKINFPRVPYPAGSKQFKSLASYGETLRKIHLLENVMPSAVLATYPIEGSNTIDKLTYKEQKVLINKKQYFENVPLEIWNFYIGGYQPAQKWLKDRKGRSLTFDEIEHYQKIVNALSLTIDIQKHIDTEIKIMPNPGN